MTSLAEIKSFNPCIEGWKAILKGQRKTRADFVLFPLVDCVESNSISDVCWLLGERQLEIQIAVKFARLCADSVAHLRIHSSAAAAAYASAAAAAASGFAFFSASGFAASAAASSSGFAPRDKQNQKNKQFLIDCFNSFERI